MIQGNIYKTDRGYVINNGTYAVQTNTQITIEMVEAYLAEHPEALIPELTPPEPTAEEKASIARRHRDAMLAECDWTQVSDAPVDQATWKMYRQALRDWPETNGFPDIATIPKAPSK